MENKTFKLQITKFGFYGFLKNLRFFEPYLLYYLTIISGLTLFQVGILFSVREIIIYIFEIPSGVIADSYGKKIELVVCFIFYIMSFIMFFLATEYYMFIIAMVLFGLGEASRSGTHKAMIMQFLDINKITVSKSKIYGQTRSMSMIGSMTMSIISIIFIIWLPDIRLLFLLSIIPYILDLLLIVSYPKYMNESSAKDFKFKGFIKENYLSIKYAATNQPVRKLLMESSSYQAAFKSIKDYIQPIIITMSIGAILFKSYTLDENLKIYIGLIYAVIYFASSFASRNAHYIVEKFDNKKTTNTMWLLSAILMFCLSFFLNSIIIVFLVFLLLYILLNIRRPLMVEQIGNAVIPTRRASVLSVDSQLKSLFVAIFAPILGYIADRNMGLMFILVSAGMMGLYIYNVIYYKIKRKENKLV